jgi:transposase
MSSRSAQEHFETSDGTVRIWIEQGMSIQIKATTEQNDPVELSESEAIEIADVLRDFASRI